jgi:hypothetical protein
MLFYHNQPDFGNQIFFLSKANQTTVFNMELAKSKETSIFITSTLFWLKRKSCIHNYIYVVITQVPWN